MYEENPGMKFDINDAYDGGYYDFIWNALGKKAQERLTDLNDTGFFMTPKYHPVRSIGIFLSLELQLMLKITTPRKKSGIKHCIYVEVCKFDLKQLETNPSGKYVHFNSKLKCD